MGCKSWLNYKIRAILLLRRFSVTCKSLCTMGCKSWLKYKIRAILLLRRYAVTCNSLCTMGRLHVSY
jgi:uncharacterized membrane protein